MKETSNQDGAASAPINKCVTATGKICPTLLLMVGLPYSGKTSFAKKMPHPIVSPDAIRFALHGQRFVSEAEPFVWAHAHLMVKSLFKAGHSTVVLDACNISKARRNEWRVDGWDLRFFHLITPADTCLERAERQQEFEIMPVIERMYQAWEPFDEGDRVSMVARGELVSCYPDGWNGRYIRTGN